MRLPDLKTATEAQVDLIPQTRGDGQPVAVVLIRRTFRVEVGQSLAPDDPEPPRFSDEPWDPDAPLSSIKLPSDVSLAKPSTDVIVVGEAIPPQGQTASDVEAFVRVGPVSRHLRVTGPRVWYRGSVGLELTPPQPFERVPLRWELAYGGFVPGDQRTAALEEPRNPVGRGVARSAADLVGQPGPQIEDVGAPISFGGTMAPAGVGAIGRHWAPRRNYVGTMDARWAEERLPLPPLDFDARFFQCAAPALITPAPLLGGELVRMINTQALGPIDTVLPRFRFFVGAQLGQELVEEPYMLDTVIVTTTERKIEMTWRAVVPLPRQPGRLRYIQVHDKTLL